MRQKVLTKACAHTHNGQVERYFQNFNKLRNQAPMGMSEKKAIITKSM